MSPTKPIDFRGPTAGRAPFARKPPGKVAPPTEDVGLPAWVFWGAAVSAGLVAFAPVLALKYLVLGAFFLVFFHAMLIAPERTILLYLLSLPTVAMFGKGFLLPGTNTILLLSLGISAVLSTPRQPQPRPRNPLFAPVIYFLLLLLASGAYSYWSGSAPAYRPGIGWVDITFASVLVNVKNRAIFLMLPPLAFALIWSRTKIRSAVHVLATLSLIASARMVWSLADKIATGNMTTFDRVKGFGFFIYDANLSGGFMAMMILVLTPLVLYAKLTLTERVFYLVTIGTTSLAMLYTLSRGAWLGALAGLLVLAMIRGGRLLVGLLLLAMSATLWIPEAVIERAKMTLNQQEEFVRQPFAEDPEALEGSFRARIEIWSAMPTLWAQSPIIGHGMGAFKLLYWEQFRPKRPLAAHATLVELAVEQGLLGLIAFFWLMAPILRSTWFLLKNDQDEFIRALAAGVVAALTCMFLVTASVALFTDGPAMTPIWILGGALTRRAAGLAGAPATRRPELVRHPATAARRDPRAQRT